MAVMYGGMARPVPTQGVSLNTLPQLSVPAAPVQAPAPAAYPKFGEWRREQGMPFIPRMSPGRDSQTPSARMNPAFAAQFRQFTDLFGPNPNPSKGRGGPSGGVQPPASSAGTGILSLDPTALAYMKLLQNGGM